MIKTCTFLVMGVHNLKFNNKPIILYKLLIINVHKQKSIFCLFIYFTFDPFVCYTLAVR
jgi:hypothetical protein